MNPYKSIGLYLCGACILLVSSATLSADKRCNINLSISGLKIENCLERDGVSVLELTPIGQPSYETNLDKIPTFVVFWKDIGRVSKVVGDGGSHYNNLIDLPYTEKIVSYFDAAKSARSKMMGGRLGDCKYERYCLREAGRRGRPWGCL
ncbi:hypothetical protein [Pseudomonas veronii]|jgi:hypothetical protein|uniref:hypothetical protein n=1 Tax=Pseudomonas veronii TaxID=76761 RepID=UPI0031F984B7